MNSTYFADLFIYLDDKTNFIGIIRKGIKRGRKPTVASFGSVSVVSYQKGHGK